MAEAPIRSVTVLAQINGKTIQVSDLEISNQVGNLATVRITGHNAEDAKGTEKSAELSLRKFAALSGELQTLVMTQPRKDPDFFVRASDAQGGEINFRGFLSSPAFSLGAGAASMVYTGVHEAAVLEFYHGEAFDRAGFGTDYVASQKKTLNPMAWKPFTGSVAGTLLDQIESATKAVEEMSIDKMANTVFKQMQFALITRNKAILPTVRAFLKASTTTSTIPFTGVVVDLEKAVRKHLWFAVTSENGLLSVIRNVLPVDYMLQFVCSLNSPSPAARLELVTYTNARPTPLNIPVESFTFTSGGVFDLPIKGVVVKGSKNTDTLKVSAQQASQLTTTAAMYPGDAVVSPGARIAVMSAPGWFNTGDAKLHVGSTNRNGPANIKAYRAKFPKLKELIADTGTAAQNLLKWWAQAKFSYLSLADSTASVRIPLNFLVHVGRVYSVRVFEASGSSTELFQGYVAQVSHRMSSRSDGLDASTAIVFTHVQGLGYIRPGDRPKL